MNRQNAFIDFDFGLKNHEFTILWKNINFK